MYAFGNREKAFIVHLDTKKEPEIPAPSGKDRSLCLEGELQAQVHAPAELAVQWFVVDTVNRHRTIRANNS